MLWDILIELMIAMLCERDDFCSTLSFSSELQEKEKYKRILYVRKIHYLIFEKIYIR